MTRPIPTRPPLVRTALLAAALAVLAASGADASTPLRAGDDAPAFSLVGSDGKTHTLAEHKGKRPVVLAWYPKAFTGGWTAQCKSLRESGNGLRKFDVAYFGASVDDAATNKKFAESLGADYPILSDPGKEIARAFGVLDESGAYAHRVTFYIGKDGKILRVDAKVSPKSAGDDTIRQLRDLGIPERK